jgi:hypothetical protein
MAQPHDPTDPSTNRSRSRSERDPSARDRIPASDDAVLNGIEFVSDRRRTAVSGSAHGLERAQKNKRTARSTKPKTQREDPHAKTSILERREHPIPDTVRERFIQIGNKFFFPDGAEAFTDHGTGVTTRSENAIVIQSMVAIAQARAAGAVTLKGTDLFKKEAWFAARLVGLAVRGYEPSTIEQERLVRAIARRHTAGKENASQKPDVGGHRTNETVERNVASAGVSRERQLDQGELIVGRLVDHGPARYQHKSNQQMSYYVRIETDRDDREIWGVDLERAFRQSLSTPGVGDEVGIRAVGRDSVTVLAAKHDGEGRELGREELATHRNQWIVERRDFLDRRRRMADLFRDPSISASEGVKQYPELEGSYLQLQIARAGVEQRIANSEARGQFVDHLRVHLARTIEYGQPLAPVHLKARAEIAPEPEKVQGRDYVPTR